MKRLVVTAAMVIAVSATVVPTASAQPIGPMPYVRPATSPYYRPAISPYLNLARPGGAGINYYGLVRPQLQANAAIQQLQLQQQLLADQQQAGLELQTGLNTQGTGNLLTTGHSSGFMNYQGYFMNWAGRGGSSMGGGINSNLGQSTLNTSNPSLVVGGGNFGRAPAGSGGGRTPSGPRR